MKAKNNHLFLFFVLAAVMWYTTPLFAQTLSATEIIKRTDENRRGKNSYSEIKMTIVRPAWSREIGFKSWSKDTDYSLTLITSPAKEKGQTFLKRQKDLWNWQPGINRMIKMSSSLMGQSWMGSDFTNDDIVRESSTINDYSHFLVTTEKVREFDCYKLILTPKANTAVVWGKVIMWVSMADYIEIKTEFYDEDDALVNTINGYDIRTFGNRKLASRMDVIPASKPNQKTEMVIEQIDFDITLADNFFSQQNMQKVK